MRVECVFAGATRRYWWISGALLALYLPVSIAAMKWIEHVQAPALRALSALSPLPFLVALAALELARIRRSDELRQRIELEAAAAAMVVSLLAVTALGLLDNAGILDAPMLLAAPVMCLAYLGAQIWAHRHYR